MICYSVKWKWCWNGIQLQNRALSEGTCTRTDCRLTLDQCPRDERNGLGDLSIKNGYYYSVACLAPCKKWNYPAPYGLGRNEQEGDGRNLCCPSPVSVDECRRGIVTQTEYVNLLRRSCPTAYSYAYDDEAGSHNCPSTTSFIVNFYSWIKWQSNFKTFINIFTQIWTINMKWQMN